MQTAPVVTQKGYLRERQNPVKVVIFQMVEPHLALNQVNIFQPMKNVRLAIVHLAGFLQVLIM
ncbi:MAG: hypothetical protein CVU29_10280 [Betaproteobacteria bacterium HGW-Betaproteobacteria-22]|nr:MAG: hypothetical protein CVU29_10280 [Betaproteobacteria bacterium HGW-Betaproteobacteria-22]